MQPKLYPQLRNEREHKLVYDQIKKYSFEEYLSYKNKVKNYFFRSSLIFFIIGMIISGIILGYPLIISLFSYEDNLQNIDARNNILVNEATKRCEDINQTFVRSIVMHEDELLHVHCSESNLIIGGKKDR